MYPTIYIYLSAELGTRHIFVDASSRHVVFSTRHHGVFSCFISVSRHASPFFKGVIKKFRIVNFKLMKTCFNAETHSQCGRSNSPLSAQRTSSPPVGDQPNPSPTRRSSSTSAYGQIHPFPLSGLLTPLFPCLPSNSPLSNSVQPSSSTPHIFGVR